MIIGVSVILKQEDRYLFEIQKTAKWIQKPDGRYQIGMGCIGGRLENGETAQQALEREIKEEVGDDCDDTFALTLTILIEYSEDEDKKISVGTGCYANMLMPEPLNRVSASLIQKVHDILGIFPAGD